MNYYLLTISEHSGKLNLSSKKYFEVVNLHTVFFIEFLFWPFRKIKKNIDTNVKFNMNRVNFGTIGTTVDGYCFLY